MGMKTAFTTGLLIIGEVAFFFSLVLLGKDFLMKVKYFLTTTGVFKKKGLIELNTSFRSFFIYLAIVNKLRFLEIIRHLLHTTAHKSEQTLVKISEVSGIV